MARLTPDSPEFAWIAAGVATYLLLTTVMELLLGRSVGKLLTGTRVVALDGRRPAPAAVLIRNLLRVVDLIMLLTEWPTKITSRRSSAAQMSSTSCA